MKNNYALIGDVHSQASPLSQALDHCRAESLTPILLGDLFDSRMEESQSAEVLRLAQQAQRELGAVILRSNHQNKFERLAKGNKVKLGQGLERTLEDFASADISVSEVAEWLETFPYGVVFKDSRGQEYRCAHAMFPSWLVVPNYEEMYRVTEVTRKARDYMLYGPHVPGAEWPQQEARLFWWEKESEREWVRVAGHYHVVHVSDTSLVLDGNMGGRLDVNPEEQECKLCLWEVESKELITFD